MFPTDVRDLSQTSGVHMMADFPFGDILGLGGGVGGGGSGLGVLARPVFLVTMAKIIVALNRSDFRFMLPRHVPVRQAPGLQTAFFTLTELQVSLNVRE